MSEGKGGFIDYSKYREQLTRIIWDGDGGEDGTTAPSGEPVPTNAMDEARALMQRSKQHLEGATK